MSDYLPIPVDIHGHPALNFLFGDHPLLGVIVTLALLSIPVLCRNIEIKFSNPFAGQCWLYYPPSLFLLLLPVVLWFMATAIKRDKDTGWALHRNDGPLGLMASDWMGGSIKEGLGTPIWQDLQFLGSQVGEVPLTSEYLHMIAVNNPQVGVPVLLGVWLFGWCLLFWFRPRKEKGGENYCEICCSPFPFPNKKISRVGNKFVCSGCLDEIILSERWAGHRRKKKKWWFDKP